MKSILVLAAAAFLAGGFFSAPSFAIGDGGSDKPTCKRGQVYDKRRQVCVQAQSGVVDDKSFAEYAYALTQDGRYEEALTMLDLMQDPNTAEALNYRGYATRMLGRVE